MNNYEWFMTLAVYINDDDDIEINIPIPTKEEKESVEFAKSVYDSQDEETKGNIAHVSVTRYDRTNAVDLCEVCNL